MTSRQRLHRLFAALLEAVDNDPGLTEQVKQILGGDAGNQAASRRRNRRNPAPIDPFLEYANGEEVLQSQLQQLDVDALKDIVAQYGMDGSKLALKWKKPERLINLILVMVRERSTKGDAFRR
jgi:hypothetical protein